MLKFVPLSNKKEKKGRRKLEMNGKNEGKGIGKGKDEKLPRITGKTQRKIQ